MFLHSYDGIYYSTLYMDGRDHVMHVCIYEGAIPRDLFYEFSVQEACDRMYCSMYNIMWKSLCECMN